MVIELKCYEFDLSRLLKVTMLGKSELIPPSQHVRRYINEYIVYVIESGRLCLLEDGERLELNPGDVCIFKKGEYQEPMENCECTFYYLHFRTDGFSEEELTDEEYCERIKRRKANFIRSDAFGEESYRYIKVLLKRKFNISESTRLEQLIGVFKNNAISYEQNLPERRMSISFGAASILMRLEDIALGLSDKAYLGKNGRVYDTAERIAEYIRVHYKENFKSTDIERELLINFDYANRIFKKYFGYSVIKYRNFLRINTAKTMILDATLDEVAQRVGFGDRYYFSRCFKKTEGISPEEYREKLRVGKEPI